MRCSGVAHALLSRGLCAPRTWPTRCSRAAYPVLTRRQRVPRERPVPASRVAVRSSPAAHPVLSRGRAFLTSGLCGPDARPMRSPRAAYSVLTYGLRRPHERPRDGHWRPEGRPLVAHGILASLPRPGRRWPCAPLVMGAPWPLVRNAIPSREACDPFALGRDPFSWPPRSRPVRTAWATLQDRMGRS
jgi:hypothetical protein